MTEKIEKAAFIVRQFMLNEDITERGCLIDVVLKVTDHNTSTRTALAISVFIAFISF